MNWLAPRIESRSSASATTTRLQDYNTYVQQFPASLFAGWAGFKANDAYFKAAEGSREVPKVNFGTPAQQSAPQPAPAK